VGATLVMQQDGNLNGSMGEWTVVGTTGGVIVSLLLPTGDD
jgi:hypothetical protein